MNRRDAYDRAKQLYDDLKRLADRDPDQEVQGLALSTLDACLQAFKESVGADPVIDQMHDAVSPELIASGEPVRAADALVAVGQLVQALKSGGGLFLGGAAFR